MSYVAIGQGAYYLATAFWSMVSMRSFQWVTGPKTDVWLVRTVALLLMVIGTVLTVAGFRKQTGPESPLLGTGSAATLAGIDIVYAAKGRISRIYFLDALVELGFLVAWAWAALFRPADGEPDR
ncbi:hypothetical protein [Nitrolancea hollandica]|uniref:Uncharacterized protein n=1 Tax=Nitrolancea hollandica Lb TaxID=1129897 RepID=I4EIY3_9BACT|nr:hypothetical protein [Nitrolancea hollandica]CCF84645.1 conserved membrane hypothetical protein [Nitrolancea hollandica Lb]